MLTKITNIFLIAILKAILNPPPEDIFDVTYNGITYK
jgi:hypothetical protein